MFEAASASEVFSMVEMVQPDILILDLMMPDMDGVDVCRKLREQEETSDLPIIMLSAKTGLSTVKAALHAGATTYLSKPVPRDKLVKTIHTILEKRDKTK